MRIGTEVYLWGSRIGILIEDEQRKTWFQYDKDFIKSEIEVSPLVMPLSRQIYSFPELNVRTFHGLPGMLADSLPDKFGNALIDGYLLRQGRARESFTVSERLCYIGKRGMGALEFVPAVKIKDLSGQNIDIDELAKLASDILTDRSSFGLQADERAVGQLLTIGTSAGGARAKALIAWNQKTGEIRSGQTYAGEDFQYWLLKFGNIENNRDKDVEADHKDYAKVEFAYSLMAKDAGLEMTECRLLKSNEGFHFLTERFDRTRQGKKLHMQTLAGLAHYDFNEPGIHGYEEVAQDMRRLKISQEQIEQLYRRLVWNEMAKNYDDHVKNISFLMDKTGKWKLAPAYDVTFSYKPDSVWTSRHQITINGKSSELQLADLEKCGMNMNLSAKKINDIIHEVAYVVHNWPAYAEYVKLPEEDAVQIQKQHNTYHQEQMTTVPLNHLLKEKEKHPYGYSLFTDSY